jgi:hypothetical protein
MIEKNCLYDRKEKKINSGVACVRRLQRDVTDSAEWNVLLNHPTQKRKGEIQLFPQATAFSKCRIPCTTVDGISL